MLKDLKEEDVSVVVWPVLDILVSSTLCASRSEAKRKINEGGVYIDGLRVTDISTSFPIKVKLRVGRVSVDVVAAVETVDNTPVALSLDKRMAPRSKGWKEREAIE